VPREATAARSARAETDGATPCPSTRARWPTSRRFERVGERRRRGRSAGAPAVVHARCGGLGRPRVRRGRAVVPAHRPRAAVSAAHRMARRAGSVSPFDHVVMMWQRRRTRRAADRDGTAPAWRRGAHRLGRVRARVSEDAGAIASRAHPARPGRGRRQCHPDDAALRGGVGCCADLAVEAAPTPCDHDAALAVGARRVLRQCTAASGLQ